MGERVTDVSRVEPRGKGAPGDHGRRRMSEWETDGQEGQEEEEGDMGGDSEEEEYEGTGGDSEEEESEGMGDSEGA
jgi:hypothetical protein